MVWGDGHTLGRRPGTGALPAVAPCNIRTRTFNRHILTSHPQPLIHGYKDLHIPDLSLPLLDISTNTSPIIHH